MNRREHSLRNCLVWWSLTLLLGVLAGGFARWGLTFSAVMTLAGGAVSLYATMDEYLYLRELIRRPWRAPVVKNTPREDPDPDYRYSSDYAPGLDDRWVSPPARESRCESASHQWRRIPDLFADYCLTCPAIREDVAAGQVARIFQNRAEYLGNLR